MIRTNFLRLAPLAIAACILSPLYAQTKLHLKVYTSPAEGFSANSTIIYGDKDAILIDTQFVVSEARKVAAMIQATRRNLTTIYITHGHPDHYFGLYVMKQTFPNAKIVALPAAINGVKNGWDARRTFWTSEFGSNLPPAGPILPEALEGNTLTLEGQQLQITDGVMGDAPNNSYVSIPSIKAVVAGDTVFAASHFTVPKNHDEWFKTLDQIAALKPAILVPGHQKIGAKDDLSAIVFMKKYMLDWDAAVASSHSADELKTKMKKLYPNLALERLMIAAADAAFAPAKK